MLNESQNIMTTQNIKLKKGQYNFQFEGKEYTIEKETFIETIGWRKVKTTKWKTSFGGQFGTTRDTKEELIDAINHKIGNWKQYKSFH